LGVVFQVLDNDESRPGLGAPVVFRGTIKKIRGGFSPDAPSFEARSRLRNRQRSLFLKLTGRAHLQLFEPQA